MKQEEVDDVVFVSPRAMQDGEVGVEPGDAISNLPYHPNVALCFDHHADGGRVLPEGVRGLIKDGPSATSLVLEYYGFDVESPFGRLQDMVHFTDRLDAARLDIEDVLNPHGWVLPGFLLNPRTGLRLEGSLCRSLIHCIRNGMKVGDIPALPEIRTATGRYFEAEDNSKILLTGRSKVYRNVLVTDLRDSLEPVIGNRFVLYATSRVAA